jgi:hypothetical protein
MLYYTAFCPLRQAFFSEERSKPAASGEEYEKIEPAQKNKQAGTSSL